MKLSELLQFEDYKEGLKALYSEYDLELGYKLEEEVSDHPGQEDDISEEDKLQYKQDQIDFRTKDSELKTTYGWSLTELWNLDESLFIFLLPRLYVFYKNDDSLDNDYEEGTFKDILEAILEALLISLCNNNNKKNLSSFEEEEAKVQKGLNLLAKYMRRLWN